MSRILILFSFIVLFVSFKVDAGSEKEELRKILATFSSYSANFEQHISNNLGEKQQELSGVMVLAKPNKLRWEVQSPDDSLLIADGVSVFNIDPFVEQVTILKQESLIDGNPLSLLISDDIDAWNNVEVTKNKKQYTLTVVDAQSSIQEIKLTFDDSNMLVGLSSFDTQGLVNHIKFSRVQINPVLSLNTFKPEIGNNFEIDDQR